MIASWAMAAVLAQVVPGASTSASDVERIRQALDEPASPLQPGQIKGATPTFRMTVWAPKPHPPLWKEPPTIPGYIRPSMPGLHFDYLSMTTPEQFRASTLYPGFSLSGFLKLLTLGFDSPEEHRRKREAKARAEVVRELEAFLRTLPPK